MTDLEVIEEALKSLVKRFNDTEVPISFETVVKWLLEEIDEAKKYRFERTKDFAIKENEMRIEIARIKAAIDDKR